MSKYIIEIAEEYEEYFKGVLICGIADGKFAVDVIAREDLEELNSDYINEHYGQLQDEAYQKGINDGSLDVKQRVEGAYQKGFEDGKNNVENGCDGCKYESISECEQPCCKCKRGCMDFYDPMSKDDRIEVGDEVIAPCGKAIVTTFKNDLVFYLYSVGDYGCTEPENLTKTGKHYDIASILEAMRE